MSGAEGIGEAVTGGLLARAVEPQAGEAGEGGGACLNCGTELGGDYCHACGQPGHVHRTLTSFWHDLVHGVLHFEGKTFRTLPLLAWRPGELTRRYIEGERARFVSPMALFLFSVFLMFAVFNIFGGPIAIAPNARIVATADEMRTEQRRIDAQIVALETRRAAAKDAAIAAAIDKELVDARRESAVMRRFGGMPTDAKSLAADDGGMLAWFNERYRHAKENPSLLIYKLQNNAYKFSWVLIPVSVPFVWLLFAFRRRYRAYDHTVFVTYSLAFMTLLAVVLAITEAIGLGSGFTMLALIVIPPIHMYRQLRGAYRIGWVGAAGRTVALLFFALIVSLLFFLLLLTLGTLG